MSISPELIKKVYYPPERVVEARSINLAANAYVDLVDLPDIPPYLVKLVNVGYLKDATNRVRCRVEGVMAGKTVENDLGSLAIPDIDDHVPFQACFDETMKVRFFSTANISNYKARAVYEVRNYSIADKLALGISKAALTAEEKRLDTKYEIQRKIACGELPMPYPGGALVKQVVGNYQANMSGGPPAEEKTVAEVYVPPGHKAVLTKLWSKRPSAQDRLEIHVYRERKPYFIINPWSLPDLSSTLDTTQMIDRALELWVPAVQHLRVMVKCLVTESDVRVMAKFDIRRLTLFDKIGWGLTLEDWEKVLVDELNLEEKYKAGIYTQYTQVRG